MSTIGTIDKAINGIRRELRKRLAIAQVRIDSSSAESWQLAWDLHPDLREREDELFRQRGAAQGEYPGLDERPSSCLRWLRQAGAVVLLIGFNFVNGGSAACHTVRPIYEPKLKPTVFAESIGKIELPENIKGDLPFTEFNDLLMGRNARDFISVQMARINARRGGQIEFTADCFLRRRIEARIKRDLANFDVYPIHSVVGWRLTTISERKTELRREREIEPGRQGVIAFGHDVFDGDISPQLPFGRLSRISQLTKNNQDQRESSYREQAREYGERIIDRLADKPRYVTLVSVFFGLFCSACGIALYLGDRGLMLSGIGIVLVGFGIITPLFPWWLLILWLAVSG